MKNIKSLGLFSLYCLMLYSMLMGASFKVLSVLSLRHICTIILLFIAINNKKKFILTEPIKWYIVYLIIYLAANVLNGEIITKSFFQSFFTFHIPSLAVIFSFPKIINSPDRLKILCNAIIFLFVLNTLITFLQFQGNSFVWDLTTFFNSNGQNAAEKSASLIYEQGRDNLFGMSLLTGLCGGPVENSYFVAVFVPIACMGIWNQYKLIRFESYFVVIFSLIVAFMIGQKSAFYMMLLYFLYFVILKIKYFLFVLVPVIVYLFISYMDFTFFTTENIGYLAELSSVDSRFVLVREFNDYIFNSDFLPVFGGYEDYLARYNIVQHNTWTSAWVYGGFFAFMIMFVMWWRVVIILVRNIKFANSISKLTPIPITCIFSCIIFLIISLVHSDGIQKGAPLFWIPYMLLVISRYSQINNYRAQ